ncbi:restriction endonuclease subunit S [Vibrio mimicus]
MSWPMVKIEDIFEVARGGSPRPIDSFITNSPDGVNWIMIGDTQVGGKYIDKTAKKIRPEGVKKSRKVKVGDFLLTNSMSFGRPYILRTSGCIHDGWLVLSPKSENIFTDYFYHYLGSQEVKNKLAAKAAGAVVKNLNKDIVKGLEIPLPPLAEQKRIAAILDKADAIRRKRQQAIDLADDFLRAVFLDMFGDPVMNPKGWELKPLKDIAKVTTGNTPSRKEEKFYGDYIEWIKSDNINTPSHFLTLANEYLSKEGAKVGRTAPIGSTLVTCIAGSFDCIGNAAYADRDVAFNQQINALTPKKGVSSWFLYALILFSKKHIQAASTNSMKGMVSKGKMEQILMINPPESKQIEFEKKFLNYLKMNEDLINSFNACSILFSSLSQRVFSDGL